MRPLYITTMTLELLISIQSCSYILNILLVLAAVGCADPHQPAHGWSKRSGTRAVLGCNDTGDRWELLCKEGRWVGKASNCSSGESELLYLLHSAFGIAVVYAFMTL